MPRMRPDRSTVVEKHLARRIHDERTARGWKLEGLASRVTAAGCPMGLTTIHMIESGNRRITVDELVAFAEVFERDPGELLWPMNAEVSALFKRHETLQRERDEKDRELQEVIERLIALADSGYSDEVNAALSASADEDGRNPAQGQMLLRRLQTSRMTPDFVAGLAETLPGFVAPTEEGD